MTRLLFLFKLQPYPCPRGIQHANHLARHLMSDNVAFGFAGSYQFAKMPDLIIEAAVSKGFVKLNYTTVKVVDSSARWIPPVFMDGDMADSSADKGITFAMQVKPGV